MCIVSVFVIFSSAELKALSGGRAWYPITSPATIPGYIRVPALLWLWLVMQPRSLGLKEAGMRLVNWRLGRW